MEIIRIHIINPKAENLLKDLEDLNLISIHDISNNDGFAEFLKKFRSKAKFAPSSEEMTKEHEDSKARTLCEKRYTE